MRRLLHTFCEKRCVKYFMAIRRHKLSDKWVPFEDDPNAYASDKTFLRLQRRLAFWSFWEMKLRAK